MRLRRSITDLLAPLVEIATHSPHLMLKPGARFDVKNETIELPGYLFIGHGRGDTPILIGIFATLHGDEPEGAYAIIHLLKSPYIIPEFAAG